MPEMTLERVARSLRRVIVAQRRDDVPDSVKEKLRQAELSGRKCIAAHQGLKWRKDWSLRPRACPTGEGDLQGRYDRPL